MLKLGPELMLFSAGVEHPLGSHTEADNHPLQHSAGPVLNAFIPSLLIPVLKQDSTPSITINSVHEKHALLLVQHPLMGRKHGRDKAETVRCLPPLLPSTPYVLP